MRVEEEEKEERVDEGKQDSEWSSLKGGGKKMKGHCFPPFPSSPVVPE